MSADTVLPTSQIERLIRDTVAAKIIQGEDIEPKDWIDFARAIEQAVLQSEQVQALRKNAERYRWLREQCEKPLGGLTICEVGLFDLKPWSGDDPDRYIDAAMEQQT